MTNVRIEKDLLGTKEVPSEAYYGIQTLRAVENFPITGIPPHVELIKALAAVKKAAAIANMEVGVLKKEIGEAIAQASDEISRVTCTINLSSIQFRAARVPR